MLSFISLWLWSISSSEGVGTRVGTGIDNNDDKAEAGEVCSDCAGPETAAKENVDGGGGAEAVMEAKKSKLLLALLLGGMAGADSV